MIGIIGAMEEEVAILKNEMIIDKKETKGFMEFTSGKLLGKKVVIVTCGIGKVNAAICTQILIDDFKVNKVINVGVAGGLGKEVYPGDIVISDSLVQHDMDTTYFGDRYGQIPRMDTFDFKADETLVKAAKTACEALKGHKSFIGRIVTGDQFISEIAKIQWLKEEFNALACEMEGASIAQVCYVNKVPFVVIRSISDNLLIDQHMDFNSFLHLAVNNSVLILKSMLISL